MTNLGPLGGNNPWMYYAFFIVGIFLLFASGALVFVDKLSIAKYE